MAKPELSGRERVLAALAHQEPDRVPWDLCATGQTGLRIETQDALLRFWELDERTEQPLDPLFRIAQPHPAFLERYPPDLVGFRPTLAPLLPEDEEEELEERYEWQIEHHLLPPTETQPARIQETARDGWGVLWERTEGESCFRPAEPPLAEAESLQEVESFPFPDPSDERQWEPFRPDAERATILGGWGRGFLETGRLLLGPRRVFRDWMAQEGFFEALAERLLESKLRYWETRRQELSAQAEPPTLLVETECLDLFEELPVDLELFRRHVKPFWRRLLEPLKEWFPESKCFLFARSYHFTHVQELIEIGVELLPLVPERIVDETMEFLKREFGGTLTFVGGGDYEPKEFLRGSQEQAADQVKRTLDIWAPSGGFLWAPYPVVEPEVPPENLVAALDTLFQYGLY
ncbi:MAG: hypothetical protein KatS3mg115_0916 [Candidatus Poribacteria bacterium]|nr:MAG: hypothetical protein KatS3mg115_0916 [Candidatus Poribacteria bacterium]